MKTIGMIGGITWNSTVEYYRIINQTIADTLGGVHSAEIQLYSFDFGMVEKMQSAGEWDKLTEIMVDRAERLKQAGADFVVICANTMHLMAPAIEKKTGLKVLHIADVTGAKVIDSGLKKITLLGTKYVMEEDFYTGLLQDKYHIDVMIPSAPQRDIIHNVIYDELAKGIINANSRKEFVDIIDDLTAKGSEGVVLGCTEIPLLISNTDVSVPVYDTTVLHATAAAMKALDD